MVNAEQFADALQKYAAEGVDRVTVDALKRFAVTAGQKLCNYSPIAQKMVPGRGRWKANWRLRLDYRDTYKERRPDPVGDRTVAKMKAIVEGGPRKLEHWGLIFITNPGKDAEEIGERYNILGFVTEDLIQESQWQQET